MKNKEDILQKNCYKWAHNKHPELRGLLCYNLNNSANKYQGAKNKLMGLQAGRADMVFYYKSKAYMIEFKIDTGSQSPEQIAWQKKIESHGFEYKIIRSFPEFQEYITSLL